jgi:pimeloyl-ACP methyl ester carboxylesterase
MSGDLWCLLHGTPLTPAVWDDVAARLRPRGFVVQPIVELAPGGDETVPELARRLLEDLAPGARLHLVGHSFGGQVALEMALSAPERVGSLTLICSRDTPYPAFDIAAAALRRGEPVDVDAALHRWFTPAELAADPALVGYARRCLADADRSVWAAALAAIARFDRSDQTPTLKSPLTLVAAELDQVSTVTAMQALADRIPTARLHVLPGAGHMSPFLQPNVLTALITGSGPHP